MKNFIILSILLFSSVILFCQEKRLALVIGNSEYSHGGVLKNPVNDANLMASTLMDLGFDVMKHTNASKQEMDLAILNFWRNLGNYDITLFYYAGHGVQIDGVNFILPIDAKIEDQYSLKIEAVNVEEVVSQFERYHNNVNIVILDACRDNPFRSWMRGGSGGFAPMSAPSGTLIAFATSAGSTASDGKGSNGLYTEKLTKQMKIEQRIEDVFINTRNEVRQASNGRQNPQEWSQLTGRFYFNNSIVSANYTDQDKEEVVLNNDDATIDEIITDSLYFKGMALPVLNGKSISDQEALAYLEMNNPLAYKEYKRFKPIHKASMGIMIPSFSIFLGSGVLGLLEKFDSPAYYSVLISSGIISVISIIIGTSNDKNKRKFTDKYNSGGFNNLKLAPTENGIGLVFNF